MRKEQTFQLRIAGSGKGGKKICHQQCGSFSIRIIEFVTFNWITLLNIHQRECVYTCLCVWVTIVIIC
jgi:hypothetical protein